MNPIFEIIVDGSLPSEPDAKTNDVDKTISVCNILEGGEKAFIERSRRLRVNIDR